MNLFQCVTRKGWHERSNQKSKEPNSSSKMLSYCLKCRKNIMESKNAKFAKINKRKLMSLSKYAACNYKKKQDLSIKQKASGL